MRVEERSYPKPTYVMLNIIGDIQELMHGKTVSANTPQGRIAFCVSMYGFDYAYRFFVTKTDGGSTVRIELSDDASDNMLYQAFALLESLMAKRPQEEERRNGA